MWSLYLYIPCPVSLLLYQWLLSCNGNYPSTREKKHSSCLIFECVPWLFTPGASLLLIKKNLELIVFGPQANVSWLDRQYLAVFVLNHQTEGFVRFGGARLRWLTAGKVADLLENANSSPWVYTCIDNVLGIFYCSGDGWSFVYRAHRSNQDGKLQQGGELGECTCKCLPKLDAHGKCFNSHTLEWRC